MGPFNYLTFSDAAKFALVAKNLVMGNGFTTDFSFWGGHLFSTAGISLLIPYSIVPFFKLFGINDFAVISSSFFYYMALIVTLFLLGKKLYGNLTGLLTALVVSTNINYIGYAFSGASEPFFSFLTVLAIYLMTLRKRFATAVSFIVVVAVYFSRPQAIIFVIGILLLYLILSFGIKKAFIYLLGSGSFLFLLDRFVVYPISGKGIVFPLLVRGIQSIFTYSPNTAVSDTLRGGAGSTLGLIEVAKKVFYNLYNFYKLLPQIMSPYLASLFLLGLLIKEKSEEAKVLKLVTVFLALTTFFIAALTIPFFRYLHPIIPLIYLFSVSAIVRIVQSQISVLRQYKIYKLKIRKQTAICIISTMVIFLFGVGQTIGVLTLDSRFEAKTVNRNKPPVYAELSFILRENTNPEDVIITNLDTWGSWYGERKTVWFPLKPELISLNSKSSMFNDIYLTSYLIDDENYYMGTEWRSVLENPNDSSKWDEYIKDNYKLKEIFSVKAKDNYENQGATSILLVRK